MTTATAQHNNDDFYSFADRPIYTADDMVVCRRNRLTGTVIGLLKDRFDYSLVCLDHGWRSHNWWTSRREAMQWMSSPNTWCRSCQHEHAAKFR